MLSALKSHTHSKTPASFPGLVEFFLLLLLSLRCLVYVRNLGNTVSLLLALFSAILFIIIRNDWDNMYCSFVFLRDYL